MGFNFDVPDYYQFVPVSLSICPCITINLSLYHYQFVP
jgi:hypothetical protein